MKKISTQSPISNTIQATCHSDCCVFDEFTDDQRPVKLGSVVDKKSVEVIELDLGTGCNLDCPLCHRNWEDAQHLKDGDNQRDINEIITQIDQYPNVKTITIAGIISEPTLHKNFLKLVDNIVKRNVLFYIYTNAETRDLNYWKDFGELCNNKTLVYFTICGSTQEIHEKYRVGSKLSKILENHRSFKEGAKFKNDVLQFIKFEYNQDDYKNMGNIRKEFSRESSIDSMAYKERFKLIKETEPDISMVKDIANKYQTISTISMERFKPGVKMDCSSYERRFISIDNNGKTFPCYLHRIYNNKMDWDGDYSKILNAEYSFCHECSKFTSELMKGTDGLMRIVEC